MLEFVEGDFGGGWDVVEVEAVGVVLGCPGCGGLADVGFASVDGAVLFGGVGGVLFEHYGDVELVKVGRTLGGIGNGFG